jgi:DNA-binding Lrp family transcriptional regulator
MAKILDEIDERIIRILRANARTPLVAIAKQAGLSRSATQERLRRLETSGPIAGYTVRYVEASAQTVRVWLFIEFAAGSLCVDVVPQLLKLNALRLCHSLSGKPDLLVLAELPNQAAIMDLREAIAGIKGVASVQTAPMLKAHFDTRTGEVSDLLAKG